MQKKINFQTTVSQTQGLNRIELRILCFKNKVNILLFHFISDFSIKLQFTKLIGAPEIYFPSTSIAAASHLTIFYCRIYFTLDLKGQVSFELNSQYKNV